MRFLPLFILALIAFTPSAFANTWVAQVDGMVCAFCAKGIETKLKEDPAVGTVTISLDDKTVTVTSAKGQTVQKETIEKAIYYMDLTLVKISETK
jgi:copper chaperone CopZ